MIRHRVGVACIALVAAMSSGCMTYAPQYFWEVSKNKVILEANNYKVDKLGVQAKGTCAYLFGVNGSIFAAGIPLSTDTAILKKAMQDLHQQANVKGKAAFLHNINVEWTVSGVPMFLIFKTVTVTADVYEFTGEYVDYRARR